MCSTSGWGAARTASQRRSFQVQISADVNSVPEQFHRHMKLRGNDDNTWVDFAFKVIPTVFTGLVLWYSGSQGRPKPSSQVATTEVARCNSNLSHAPVTSSYPNAQIDKFPSTSIVPQSILTRIVFPAVWTNMHAMVRARDHFTNSLSRFFALSMPSQENRSAPVKAAAS